MLINLSINNVAVIEKATADFSDGFNILTGETGAGKSLLIDSLSMVLGMRTSRELIRTEADYASVTALFSPCPDFSDLDIDPEEDGSILLSRRIYADGRNICKINSATVPLSTLRQVGERLVTIHGQHDNISLFKHSYHLSLLDEYAKNEQLLCEYKSAYKKMLDAKDKLEGMKKSESEREMQKDTLSFRIEEIKKISPEKDEDVSLASRRDALRNYSSVMANLQSASEALSSQGGAKDALYASMRNLDSASSMDLSLEPIKEQITDLYYACEDAASEIAGFISRMSFSPGELDEIEERLDAITRLKKKYGPTLDAVLENLNTWEEEYGSLLFYDDNLSALENLVCEATEEMLRAGRALSASRQKAAQALEKAVTDELAFLDMPKCIFRVNLTEDEPSSKGLENAEFLLSTSPSEEPKPLSRIASGGEMSRIMLALKSALADCDDVGVLLFDEIDAGVSGRAAAKIAEKLNNLSANRQIICITHLPQLASRADCHLLIEKDTSTDTFTTSVSLLDKEGRVDEIARLISGDNITPAAREAAKDMLKNN
ncbi:MAG: DNA repair protein RecN [Clostridia bacterium]|nr:DNA repair protein RecN [Clostridia bacterium]